MKIIFEDNHILAVVKPPGVLAQSDGSDKPDILTMAKKYLIERYDKKGDAFVGLVHRLDLNVGGAMLLAKTSKGASRLSAQMREKRFYKGYFAITSNMAVPTLPNSSKPPMAASDAKFGVLVNHLIKDERKNMVFESPEGKLSLLYYEHIASVGGNKQLYFCVPVTGRTHQIRAQMAFAGAPLINESKYVKGKSTHFSMGKPIGLWSAVISVEPPVKNTESDARMMFKSLPEGEPWDNEALEEAEKFLTTVQDEIFIKAKQYAEKGIVESNEYK